MANFSSIIWCIYNINALIKNGSASKTATLFFLVPPVSVLMAWFFLNETITMTDLIGLLIATLGVYIATRSNNNLTQS